MRTYHLVILGLVALLCGSASVATGNILHQINYQGQLADSLGNPVDTTIAMTFKIYHESTGGTYIWTETHATVNVVGGLFSVALGSGTAIPDSLFLDTTLYLGVTIGGDSELSPRTKLTSSAFSYRIQSIDGATGGTINGDLTVTGSAIITTIDTNLTVNGTMNIGANNMNSGLYSFVAGNNDTVYGDYASICAGAINRADSAYAFIGGGDSNIVSTRFGVIGGGRLNTVSGSWFGTIAGGRGNTATGSGSFVAGMRNTASAATASVLGGGMNIASEANAVVVGGMYNEASGWGAIAMGRHAKARHDGSVVINAAFDDTTRSGADYQVVMRAPGGFYLTSSAGTAPDYSSTRLINTNTGAYLTTGGVWTNSSDRNKKENFAPINDEGILQKIADMPITKWNFKTEDPSIKHIGPMAQDFYDAFGLGNDDKTIPSTDADGVALAAIQALYKKTQEIDTLKAEIKELQGMVQVLLGMQNRPANPNADMASSK